MKNRRQDYPPPLIGLSYIFIKIGVLPGLLLIFIALAITGFGVRSLVRKAHN